MAGIFVYHYDPDTGAFMNTSSEADEDPKEPGRFLIPAHATREIPPSVHDPKKQHAVFRDREWHIELKPVEPALAINLSGAPVEGMWPRLSIKEALKGGVT